MDLMIEKELNQGMKKLFNIKEEGLIIWLISVAKKLGVTYFSYFCSLSHFFMSFYFLHILFLFFLFCVCLFGKIFNKNYF